MVEIKSRHPMNTIGYWSRNTGKNKVENLQELIYFEINVIRKSLKYTNMRQDDIMRGLMMNGKN